MFPAAFFAPRMFAPRYFPKVGATSTFYPFWLGTVNQQVGPTPQEPNPA